jgi:hypothetical protein
MAPHGGVIGRLIASLQRLRDLPKDADTGELRAVVCEYVDELKAAGEPPQRVIAVVKDVARAHLDRQLDQAATRAVVDRMVRWCIERYYREG